MKTHLCTLTMVLTTLTSLSCDCKTYPVESYANKTDYIFTGQVIELLEKIDQSEFLDTPENKEFYKTRSYKVKVLVIEKLKTGQIKNDTLEFTSDLSNCVPLYELGASYLFFAAEAENKKFKMTHCTPWGKVAESEENISKLKKYLEKN